MYDKKWARINKILLECRVAQSMKIIAVNKSYTPAAAAEILTHQKNKHKNQLDRYFLHDVYVQLLAAYCAHENKCRLLKKNSER